MDEKKFEAAYNHAFDQLSKTKPKKEKTTSVSNLIDKIEDYVGGNIEGNEEIDRMGFTRFLRGVLSQAHSEGFNDGAEKIAEINEEEAK